MRCTPPAAPTARPLRSPPNWRLPTSRYPRRRLASQCRAVRRPAGRELMERERQTWRPTRQSSCPELDRHEVSGGAAVVCVVR